MLWLLRLRLVAFLSSALISSAAAAPAGPEPVASYRLQVNLDQHTHQVTGQGTIRFRNVSSVALSELYFHLYLNAFRNTESVFSRSPFVRGRGQGETKQWSYIEVQTLTAGGQDLWPKREYVADPDWTDVRVPLEAALLPGEELELHVEWTSQLPRLVERTGFVEDYHFVAQWFPKLAKLERDGSWAHFAFHPHAEFYADFGDYDITIEVAEPFVVGATGVRTSESLHDGTKTLRYEAHGVHDFAWTAWPEFRVHEDQVHGVEVRILYPASHERNLERTRAAIAYGLEHFGAAYGQYPYPSLTAVYPPAIGANSGGMEYPTLITTGGSWYSSYFSRSIELVTLHELGHQWFYGLLANNEARFPFLDEGLNSYAETRAAQTWFGPSSAGRLWDLSVSVSALHRAAQERSGPAHAIASSAAEFSSFRALGTTVYSRTATLFLTLAGAYGDEALTQALERYTKEQRFRHPAPDDWLRVLEQYLGADARRQTEIALFQRGFIDYEVSELRSEAATKPAGFFGEGAERTLKEASGEAQPTGYQNRVTITRRGNLQLPVVVEWTENDGSRTRQTWDGKDPVLVLEPVTTAPLESVVVDPDRQLPLDDNLFNNAKTQSPVAALRSYERSWYFAELLLNWLGP